MPGRLSPAEPRDLSGTPPSRGRVLAASPASYASRAAKLPPFLMLYGTADGQVPIKLTHDFVADLRKNGHRDLTCITYPGVDHCPWSIQWEQQRVPAAKDSRKTIEEFFDRTIKNRKSPSRPQAPAAERAPAY